MDAIATILENAKLASSIDDATLSLPDGWEITIVIEPGEIHVGLTYCGECVACDVSGSLADQVRAAMDRVQRYAE
jgi:hypothetical protein